MLDKLKPAWGVYKCRQSLEALTMDELAGLLEEVEHRVSFFGRQWSVALFILVTMVTSCYGS